jgi:hypothetical protein
MTRASIHSLAVGPDIQACCVAKTGWLSSKSVPGPIGIAEGFVGHSFALAFQRCLRAALLRLHSGAVVMHRWCHDPSDASFAATSAP